MNFFSFTNISLTHYFHNIIGFKLPVLYVTCARHCIWYVDYMVYNTGHQYTYKIPLSCNPIKLRYLLKSLRFQDIVWMWDIVISSSSSSYSASLFIPLIAKLWIQGFLWNAFVNMDTTGGLSLNFGQHNAGASSENNTGQNMDKETQKRPVRTWPWNNSQLEKNPRQSQKSKPGPFDQ